MTMLGEIIVVLGCLGILSVLYFRRGKQTAMASFSQD